MPQFGQRSLTKLEECHPDLQVLLFDLIEIMDVTILCGHRNQEQQNEAFSTGKSQLEWPNSKHNSTPSLAVDVAPYPIDWNDLHSFERMCGIIEGLAKSRGIKIRLGRDFSFKDYPHIELLEY